MNRDRRGQLGTEVGALPRFGSTGADVGVLCKRHVRDAGRMVRDNVSPSGTVSTAGTRRTAHRCTGLRVSDIFSIYHTNGRAYSGCQSIHPTAGTLFGSQQYWYTTRAKAPHGRPRYVCVPLPRMVEWSITYQNASSLARPDAVMFPSAMVCSPMMSLGTREEKNRGAHLDDRVRDPDAVGRVDASSARRWWEVVEQRTNQLTRRVAQKSGFDRPR